MEASPLHYVHDVWYVNNCHRDFAQIIHQCPIFVKPYTMTVMDYGTAVTTTTLDKHGYYVPRDPHVQQTVIS